MKPLAVIPSYARTGKDLETLSECLSSLRATADCAVLVVDDGGPLEGAVHLAHTYGGGAVRTENRGFSRATNVGLVQAYEEDRDAVLVNSDIVFKRHGWLEHMQANGGDIVGALLLYPHRVVQHAGIGWSPLMRAWSERLKFAPRDLPAVHEPKDCPVTGALQFICHTTMEAIDFYDEDFRMGWEDCDYCVRADIAGLRVAYEPKAVAYHHESLTRGRRTEKITQWTNESWSHFQAKWKDQDFRRFPLHHG